MKQTDILIPKQLDRSVSAPTPIYRQIEWVLKEMIDEAELSPGDRIPSERDLAEEFGVSRMTVRKAVDNLVQLGFLERDSTSGTRVREPQVTRGIGSATTKSISKLLHNSGAQAGSRLLFFEERRAPKKLAERLELNVGEPLVVIKRLRLTNDQPFCIETSYIPRRFVPDLIAADLLEGGSLYQLLEERQGIRVVASDQTLSIAYATETEAELLNLEARTAVLLQRSIVQDDQGRRVEYVTSVNHPKLVVFRSNGDI